jgi:hypothetical protein
VDTFWIFFIAIALIVGATAVWGSVQETKRTKQWQEVAQGLGVDFLGDLSDVLSRYGHLRLFQVGSSRRVSNALVVDSGEVRVVTGDFQYQTGSGKNRSTQHRTICVLESDTLQVPRVYLRPEVRFFDALGSAFGKQDIDFAEDPQFSTAYVLQGDDEAAIRELFGTDVRAWFAERAGRGFHFEAQGTTLVFHLGKRVPPQQAPELMDQALQILKLLRKQSSKSGLA